MNHLAQKFSITHVAIVSRILNGFIPAARAQGRSLWEVNANGSNLHRIDGYTGHRRLSSLGHTPSAMRAFSWTNFSSAFNSVFHARTKLGASRWHRMTLLAQKFSIIHMFTVCFLSMIAKGGHQEKGIQNRPDRGTCASIRPAPDGLRAAAQCRLRLFS